MEDIARLNQTLERINNTLDRLTIILDKKEKEYTGYNKGLSSIEERLQTIKDNKQDSPIVLTKYNPDGLQSLLRHNLDDWSVNFILNILESDYETVTEKQLKKLKEIATKVNYTGSLVL